jgi:hypothetical protein
MDQMDQTHSLLPLLQLVAVVALEPTDHLLVLVGLAVALDIVELAEMVILHLGRHLKEMLVVVYLVALQIMVVLAVVAQAQRDQVEALPQVVLAVPECLHLFLVHLCFMLVAEVAVVTTAAQVAQAAQVLAGQGVHLALLAEMELRIEAEVVAVPVRNLRLLVVMVALA